MSSASSPRPLVLLANDDGVRAEGIQALGAALATWAEVVICAPDSEQSASSHSLSLYRPLRLTQHGEGVYSVDGTPADSVYVALYAEGVLPREPDLVVSGMNHGLNLGVDVFYSGTVAAAREGALRGYVSLAVSASPEADTAAAAREASRIARGIVEIGMQGPRLFNVNFPPGSAWPVRATRLGRRVYGGGVLERLDPRGRPYFWIGGSSEVVHESAPGSDTEAYDAGMVGVTPLVLDLWSSALEPDAQLLVDALQSGRRD
ncbi:MAG: 5'/3'-nucleotidase SurE [Myxococcales bacterium]|jgi:5'-nucleotidase|nr:5'/3'-nucleotidase SurE [Myxococcales bacterium]